MYMEIKPNLVLKLIIRASVYTLVGASLFTLTSCDSGGLDDENSSDTSSDPLEDGDALLTKLPDAFAEFDSGNTTIYINGPNVVVQTNGLPNHASPYWSPTHALYTAPSATSTASMAPGYIDDFSGSYTLTVDGTPELAATTTATGLGAIGIAVSGSVIYNDEEGGGVALDSALPSLDYTGAHTGPQSYHYHLEPTAWSSDDTALIGIMADGFFLYGRRCASTGGYPADLDASGGHTGPTLHNEDDEYHYHIQNTPYITGTYILFPGDFQGTPSTIQ